MAVTPINVARVSQNLRAFNLLSTVRSSTLGLFRTQNQLATGLKFLTPSENPAGSAQVLALEQQSERLTQLHDNVRDANANLVAVEAAMQDAMNLILQANVIASENVNDTVDEDARAAAAILVDGLVDQLVAVGNRQHLGTYLFAGHATDLLPFEWTSTGVLYRGDNASPMVIVEPDFTSAAFRLPGQDFFKSVSSGVRGWRDLNPGLTTSTRVGDLRGTTGEGIRLGTIEVSVGAQSAQIDLSGAATVGDLLDKLNAELPSPLAASMTAQGIEIAPTGAGGAVLFTVTDVGAGQAARDLGLHLPGGGTLAGGADLDAALTLRSRIADLNAGSGVVLSGGITIRNGNQTATIDLSGAQTVEDVLNLINETNLGAKAAISADGRSIDVVNRVSGASLAVEENGGLAASNLGIRSMHAGTLLSELNNGDGIRTIAGDDVRVTTADGTTIDVDIDGARTIQDVLDLFNTAGSGSITAALVPTGNGIVITDDTTGGGTIHVDRINASPAIDGLGLNVRPNTAGTALVGADADPQRVSSPFTALIDMRAALENNDTRGITASAQRLEAAMAQMQEVQGRAASLARAMQDRAARIDDGVTATQLLLSDVRDVDMTEAIVRFQQVQNALQANLTTSSRIMNLSLIDYLR